MNPRTVLVAENDPDQLALLEAYLVDRGYHVLTAFDGAEAVRVATAERPDAVVLDIDLPAIRGDDVLRELKARRVRTRVIMWSASHSGEDYVKFMRLGAAEFVAKEGQHGKVVEAIRRVIEVEPTLDVEFSEPVQQNQKLVAENAGLIEQVRKLESRLQELGLRKADRTQLADENEHLREENVKLKSRVHELENADRTRNRRTTHIDALISLASKLIAVAVAVGAVVLLIRTGVLPEINPSWIVVLALLLILPLDRATHFVLEKIGKVEMSRHDH